MRTNPLRVLLGTLAMVLCGLVFVPGNIGCGGTNGATVPDETVTTPEVTPTATAIAVTLTPADGATNVALDAAVTAVFQAAITEPADWATALMLQRDGAGAKSAMSIHIRHTINTLGLSLRSPNS